MSVRLSASLSLARSYLSRPAQVISMHTTHRRHTADDYGWVSLHEWHKCVRQQFEWQDDDDERMSSNDSCCSSCCRCQRYSNTGWVFAIAWDRWFTSSVVLAIEKKQCISPLKAVGSARTPPYLRDGGKDQPSNRGCL